MEQQQVEFAKKMKENCYSESDFKKVAREINQLYEQNQELTLLNKRLKHEIRKLQGKEEDYLALLSQVPELRELLPLEAKDPRE